jgi:hypothetical protein
MIRITEFYVISPVYEAQRQVIIMYKFDGMWVFGMASPRCVLYIKLAM